MKKVVVSILLLGILCSSLCGCGTTSDRTNTVSTQSNDDMLLLIQNNDLILFNQDEGTEYVIDDEYILGDASADLLSTRAYFSEDGNTLIYYSNPGDYYRLNILDWNEACANPENIVPVRAFDRVELDEFQITSESIGYVSYGNLHWYMISENENYELGTFDCLHDEYYISEDGNSILVDSDDTIHLYAYDDASLHEAYQEADRFVYAYTADLTQIVLGTFLDFDFNVAGTSLLEYDGWQATNNTLTDEQEISWGLATVYDTQLNSTSEYGRSRTDFCGSSNKVIDPTYPVIGWSWNESEEVTELFANGLVAFQTNLYGNFRNKVFDPIHNLFYIDAGNPKKGFYLYVYSIEKNLIVEEIQISDQIQTMTFDPATGTLFFYEEEEDDTYTLYCILDGNVLTPKKIIENAGYPFSQSGYTYNGALQFDEQTGRIFCWTDGPYDGGTQHTGAMYEITVDNDVTLEHIADQANLISWGIQGNDLYYIGDCSETFAGTLYRYDGETKTALKSGVQGIITNTEHYAYFPGY